MKSSDFLNAPGLGRALLATSSLILVSGLAACVSSPAPGIHKVGPTTSFTAANSGTPHSAVPAGAGAGDVLVSAVETYPFATIKFPAGWVHALDGVNGTGTRVAVWYHVLAAGEKTVNATVSPSTQVSMVTADFSGVNTAWPLDSDVATSPSDMAPSITTTGANEMLVRVFGSSGWQVKTAIASATAVQNGGNSSVGLTSGPFSKPATTGAASWKLSPTGTAAYSATFALRPRNSSGPPPNTKGAGGSTPTPTPTPSSSPTPTPTPTSTPTQSPTPTPTLTTTPTQPPVTGSAPTAPPALICGNASMLTGPTTAPAGAITVSTAQNLNTAVQNAAAGSTFYITSGVHTLGTGQYDQVIPKSGDTFIGAPGAILDGQHLNDYAFTQQASNVTIEYLTIQDFGRPGGNPGEGVVNHDSGSGWTVTHNTITASAGAGVMIGSNNVVSYNCLSYNGEYGFSAYHSGGVGNVTLDHNEISDNNTDNWEQRVSGCGCSGGGKFWATNGAVITNNYVHNNKSVGLWADTDNAGFLFSGNYISDNDAEGIIYEISYNAQIVNNTFLRNANVAGPTNPGFPDPALYISESGSDSRVAGPYGDQFLVSGNVFTNNWAGVVLWESADRFCGSPNNTSGGFCTLVNPSLSTTNGCTQSQIANQPYYSDCRWKTQNVLVTKNTFSFTPASIGSSCTTSNSCGLNGIFSQWGTSPTWSPYQGALIENAIASRQNNHFTNNTYNGPWRFFNHDTGTEFSFAQWTAAPISQDAGSTSN